MAGLPGMVEITSPVEGTVVAIGHAAGHHVRPRDAVATVAGDTRIAVPASVAGIVREVRAEVGAPVVPGDVLVVVEAYQDAPTPQDGQPLPQRAQPPGGKCTYCGSGQLEPGFLEGKTTGYTRWIEGQLQLGPFGGARVVGRRRRAVNSYRCVVCGHLELFAASHD
jgi:hypothetical protein